MDATNKTDTMQTNQATQTSNKRCKDCNVLKPTSEFYKVRKNYIQSYCKECYYKRTFQQHRKKHPKKPERGFNSLSEDNKQYLINSLNSGVKRDIIANKIGVSALSIYLWKRAGKIPNLDSDAENSEDDIKYEE